MFVRSIARGSNYCIRSLWINTHTYSLSFHSCFFLGGERGDRREECIVLWGKRGDRFEVVRGWAGIKNGGWDRVVMIKTVIICVRLSVWAQ